MKEKLIEALEEVCDEETFIAFIAALAADRAESVKKEALKPSSPYGPDANGWENIKIEEFLEAAADWASVSQPGLKHYKKPENTWKRCADILYAGKICE